MKASDLQCYKNGCNEQAIVFVGMNDPDAEEYPVCRKHADKYRMDAIMELTKPTEEKG